MTHIYAGSSTVAFKPVLAVQEALLQYWPSLDCIAPQILLIAGRAARVLHHRTAVASLVHAVGHLKAELCKIYVLHTAIYWVRSLCDHLMEIRVVGGIVCYNTNRFSTVLARNIMRNANSMIIGVRSGP